MFSKPLLAAIAAGTAASLLFTVFLSLGLGGPFVMLPAFLLLSLGLQNGAISLLIGITAGTLLVVPFNSGILSLLFLGFLGIPCALFLAALLRRPHGVFLPVGWALADLTIYAALIITGVILHYAHGDAGFQSVLQEQVVKSFSDATPEMQAAVQTAVERFGFVLVGASAWWWIVLLYVHAWLAHWVLKSRNTVLRSSLALSPFHLSPLWLVSLGIAAAASLTGETTISFLGKSLFVTFLLPYFLLGITIVHSHARTWPGRPLLLGMLYLFILTQFWPALIIAGLGVWRQLKTIRVMG